MSLLLNPVSIKVCDSFYPLSNTTATSLVDHLPIGSPATGLLVSGCDPRKILYTIYSEQDNGEHLHYNVDVKDFPDSTISHVVRKNLLFSVNFPGDEF